MNEKIAGRIVRMSKKAAYKAVGESFPMGAHEIKPPEELLKKKRSIKNESTMQRDS